MAEPTISYLIVLGSTLIGSLLALLGVFIANRANNDQLKKKIEHEATQRQDQLLRERGEELYELVDKWLGSLIGNSLNLIWVMQGKITYNQHLDSVIESGKKRNIKFGRIEMLIDVYFPSVRADYQEVLESRDQLNEISKHHKWAYKDGDTNGERFLKPFIAAQKKIENLGKDFKKEIIKEIRSI